MINGIGIHLKLSCVLHHQTSDNSDLIYGKQGVLQREITAVYTRLVMRSSVQLKRRTAVSANITGHISAALDVYTNRLLACSAKSLSQMV